MRGVRIGGGFFIAPSVQVVTHSFAKDEKSLNDPSFSNHTPMMQLIFSSMKAGHTSGKPTRRPTPPFLSSSDDDVRELTMRHSSR